MMFLIIAITLAVSATCSLLEAALYSTRIPALEAARNVTNLRVKAERFLKLKKEIASPTAAILILNTVANTAGATYAGSLAADSLGPGYVLAFSLCLTAAILFIAEIFPKTYGATHWRSLWPVLALPLTFMVLTLKPLIWLTGQFSRWAGGDGSPPTVTEEEIRASVQMGGRSGALTAHELQMLEGVFHFDQIQARDIMVPRDEIVFCDLDKPEDEFIQVLRTSPFTRFPACHGHLDKVVGMLHVKDFAGWAGDDTRLLPDLIRDVPRVPATISINRLLREMQATRRQMALVVDEYGVICGMVTVKDILEQIVGSLNDEYESNSAQIIPRGENAFEIPGEMALTRLQREFKLDWYAQGVTTTSGFLVHKLGRLPKEGDQFEIDNVKIEAIAAKGNRIDRIKLTFKDAPRFLGRLNPDDPSQDESESSN